MELKGGCREAALTLRSNAHALVTLVPINHLSTGLRLPWSFYSDMEAPARIWLTFRDSLQEGFGDCRSGSGVTWSHFFWKSINTQSIIRMMRWGGLANLRTVEMWAGLIVCKRKIKTLPYHAKNNAVWIFAQKPVLHNLFHLPSEVYFLFNHIFIQANCIKYNRIAAIP